MAKDAPPRLPCRRCGCVAKEIRGFCYTAEPREPAASTSRFGKKPLERLHRLGSTSTSDPGGERRPWIVAFGDLLGSTQSAVDECLLCAATLATLRPVHVRQLVQQCSQHHPAPRLEGFLSESDLVREFFDDPPVARDIGRVVDPNRSVVQQGAQAAPVR